MSKLSDRLAGLEDPYLQCRTRRHLFHEIPDDMTRLRKWPENKATLRLCSQCERCTTVRYEAWNAYTGVILDSTYVYPYGYSISGINYKAKDIRKEYIDRRRNSENGKFS